LLNLIGFNSSFDLVIKQTLFPVIIATGIIIIKASTGNSSGKMGGRCHRSYNVYGCCCCGLCGPSTCYRSAGVKLGLVVWLIYLPRVVLRGMPLHWQEGSLVWWATSCSQKGHFRSRGLISWERLLDGHSLAQTCNTTCRTLISSETIPCRSDL
jgi:hypothetical protein